MSGRLRVPCMAVLMLTMLALIVWPAPLLAHDVGGRDAAFVAATRGPAIGPFLYLGAKHMVTGIDHLLFLLGVIFFLRRFRDIAVCVSLFSLGHSITLLVGVLSGFAFDSNLVDAVIGLSVVYKAFDNLSGVAALGLPRPQVHWAIFAFGLVHGMGLAGKLLDLGLHPEGLVANLVSFNVGVEIGQATALALVLPPLLLWRRHASFQRFALVCNWAMIVAGFALAGTHIAAYVFAKGIAS